MNPMNYKTMINSRFYQMKCKSIVIAKQYDSWNCSLAVTLAIMRFMHAFNYNIVSKDWIVPEENELFRAIIPSRIFDSIGYSLTDKEHLKFVRQEIYNNVDSLSKIISRQYKTAAIPDILKAKLASQIYKEIQVEDKTSEVSMYMTLLTKEMITTMPFGMKYNNVKRHFHDLMNLTMNS